MVILEETKTASGIEPTTSGVAVATLATAPTRRSENSLNVGRAPCQFGGAKQLRAALVLEERGVVERRATEAISGFWKMIGLILASFQNFLFIG